MKTSLWRVYRNCMKILYADWIVRNKHNFTVSKENTELKADVAKLEVILIKKNLELDKIKGQLEKSTQTLDKFNSSTIKTNSRLMKVKDNKIGLGFDDNIFEVGESSKPIVFVRESIMSSKTPSPSPSIKNSPLKRQIPTQESKQRKCQFICHCLKLGNIRPYCFKMRHDHIY